MAERFHKKIYFELAKAPESFSLFDSFLVLCFAGELFTAAEERVFSNKTSVREIISPEERSFSLLLFSLEQREREREREKAEQRSRENKRRKENETREPPEYSSSLFSSE